MELILDCFGSSVRLTDERLAHILEHTELSELQGELKEVLQIPNEVRLSQADDDVRLFTGFIRTPE